MSAGIYRVRAEFGTLGLPLTYVVVANSPEHAKSLLADDKDMESVGEICLIGTPTDPAPRVIA